jgi:hypothetical protein
MDQQNVPTRDLDAALQLMRQVARRGGENGLGIRKGLLEGSTLISRKFNTATSKIIVALPSMSNIELTGASEKPRRARVERHVMSFD